VERVGAEVGAGGGIKTPSPVCNCLFHSTCILPLPRPLPLPQPYPSRGQMSDEKFICELQSIKFPASAFWIWSCGVKEFLTSLAKAKNAANSKHYATVACMTEVARKTKVFALNTAERIILVSGCRGHVCLVWQLLKLKPGDTEMTVIKETDLYTWSWGAPTLVIPASETVQPDTELTTGDINSKHRPPQ